MESFRLTGTLHVTFNFDTIVASMESLKSEEFEDQLQGMDQRELAQMLITNEHGKIANSTVHTVDIGELYVSKITPNKNPFE